MGTAVTGLGPCGGQKHTCDSGPRPSAPPCLGDVEPGSEVDGGEAATPEPPPSQSVTEAL